MNDCENYFLVDVTTLVKWNRPPVGIIRTQLELVNYLLKYEPDAKYFRFSDIRDNMHELNKEEVQGIVGKLYNITSSSKVGNNFNASPLKETPLKRKIRRALTILNNEGFISLLITLCKKYCPLRAKSFAKRFYLILKINKKPEVTSQSDEHSINELMFNPAMIHANSNTPSFITKDAILISIGLDWGDSNYPYLYWLKKKIGFKFVGALYDGIPVLHPEYVMSFAFSQMFFNHIYFLTHLADKIFCISNYSENQLKQICSDHQIPKPESKTIFLGDSFLSTCDTQKESSRTHKSDYVLYVSTVEARKNHQILLKVWTELLNDKNIDVPDLVFVGMMGWGVDEMMHSYYQNKLLQKHIHFYHDVDDIELVSLYKESKFTVFPSHYEGWGLGAAESMIYGKACVISDCPAIMEATQTLMPAINANDLNGWISMIKTLITDDNKLTELENSIKTRFKPRTWEQFSKNFTQFARD